MISFLRGKLVRKAPPLIVLDVNGVGYEVEAPMTVFYDLPEIGLEITLQTQLIVREDAHNLFGFANEADKALFKTLIKINGVGAKLALAILSGQSAEQFQLCIQNNDTQALVKLPGVGKKTAERLVMELRDKLPKESDAQPLVMSTANSAREEAISALCSLGYKPLEASRMISAVEEPEEKSCEMLIRQALQGSVR
ncbi:MAG TPA: Holliday junction branch migration protein RuvA [Methylococcaceae bacterium]|nr:Holliday junction branch migration protein RuvA [Methylococcaceae bacterium]